MADVDIFMLIKDRKEFTDLTLKFLFAFTDFSLVNRLVLVNDNSTDGADEVCRSWINKMGLGEVVNVRGGQ